MDFNNKSTECVKSIKTIALNFTPYYSQDKP